MAVAHDASTPSNWQFEGTPRVIAHTPVGTPKGVVVMISEGGGTAQDEITSVTYGGVTMTRVGTVADTTTEAMRAYVYFLGSGIPTGAQNCSIAYSGTATAKSATVNTITAAADTEVSASGSVVDDQANPQVSLTPSVGRVGIAYAVLATGLGDPVGGTTELSGVTFLDDFDDGNYGAVHGMQTTPASGAFTIGWTAASDDVALYAVSVSEVATSTTSDPMGMSGFFGG